MALVTAETENRLLAVDLRSGRVIRRIPLPADPQNVAVTGSLAVVVSTAGRAVSLIDGPAWRPQRDLRGFVAPHIPLVLPDGEWAYVTDDAAGTLSVIELVSGRVVARLQIGRGAHHLSASPDQRRVWVALGESARRIVILDSSNPGHPRIAGSFDPGFAAHDLAFAPGGDRVWVTSDAGPGVAVLSARTHRRLFSVRVGPPPQHVTFDGHSAYLTSGYGSVIERVDARTGRVLARARTPYGSFELDAAQGYVATSSLLRGTLAIFDAGLRPDRVVRLAPRTRDLAIARG